MRQRGMIKTRATIAMLMGLTTLGALSSCDPNCQDPKNANSATCKVIDTAVNCTGVSSLPTAVAVVEPIIQKLLATAARQPDGSINWPSIEQQLINIAIQYGMCVVAEVWSDLMGGVAVLAGARLAPDDLKQEFDRIRARVSPGRTITVTSGKQL